MKLKKHLFLIIFNISILLAYETPTERYLTEHPIEQIENHFRDEFLGDEFSNRRSFFQQLVENEKKHPIIGYHGSTQNFRIFQDILQAVFEEIFDYKIPEDFYFFRVPGENDYDFPQGKDSFYDQFERDLSPKNLDLMIKTFLFNPLQERFGYELSMKIFRDEEQESLRQLFIDFANFLDALDSPFFQIEFNESINSSKTIAVNYIPNEHATTEEIAHKNEVSKKLTDLLKKQSAAYPLKAFGSPQFDLDIENYTRLIKEGFNKKQIEIPENCIKTWLESQITPQQMLLAFWNLGYDSKLTDNEYLAVETFLMPFLDTRIEQQKRLICMNIPLYGNYFRWDESSISIFLEDSSIESGDRHVKKALRTFFSEIGLHPKLVKILFKEAKKMMSKDPGSSHGCLYQFFDMDTEFPYLKADSSAYVSFDFGVPYYSTSPSEVITGAHHLSTNQIDLQLRLIMSNQSTLNPFGQFRIIRYDEVSPTIARAILESIKTKLRLAEIDHEKVEAYKAKLEPFWILPNP